MIQLKALNKDLDINHCISAGRVEWFDEIGSTNDHIMNLEQFHGAVCVAGLQTQGRGRRGRQWLAPAGSSILMSMGWRVPVAGVAGLSLACGLGVYDALTELGVQGVSLKWPNDVLINGKKLAGILVELGKNRIVIGIGLNVNIQRNHFQYPTETRLPWTDLSNEGYRIEFQQILLQLILHNCEALQAFSDAGFAPVQDRWNRHHGAHQKQITLQGKEPVRGKVVGVDVDGALLLETTEGRRKFYAGEVSMSLNG